MRFILLIISLLSLLSCSSNGPKMDSYSFYHWKAKAKMTTEFENKVGSGLDRVYMHYFDIDMINDYDRKPKYVLNEVDHWYKNQNIVPVVYITNQSLKRQYGIESMAKNITHLVNQISNHQFGKHISELQIDCDWTESTRDNYFKLLSLLNHNFTVSTTIRLHQIKYPKQMGVPPVAKGILMLYNVGDLADMTSNSILSSSIVNDYISSNTKYPIPLDLALPLFSQTVIKNSGGQVRLLNHIPTELEQTDLFLKVDEHLYSPKDDQIFKGFYLTTKHRLKTERVSKEELIKSAKVIKDSDLNIESIIFYHLDENSIDSYSIPELIQQYENL